MSRKLLLEKMRVFYMNQLELVKPQEVWKVTFRSDVTGNILEYETDTLRQAELFREKFHLLSDPTIMPHRVIQTKVLN